MSSYAIEFDYSGYLSIGAGKVSHDLAKFDDYDDSISFGNDSVFGFQLDTKFNEKFEFAGQIVARGYSQDGYDEFEPQLEWAFVSYRFAPAWSVRVGRLRTPYYLITDYKEVGYAYPWVRPNVDAYNSILAFLNNYDGMELLYNSKLAGFDFSAQLVAGSYEKLNYSTRVIADSTAGIILTIGTEHLTLRLNHSESVIDLQVEGSDQLVSAFETIGIAYPSFAAISHTGLIDNEPYIYDSVGVLFDRDGWLVHSEFYTIETTHPTAQNFQAAYLSIAYQFETLTPYAMIGSYKAFGGGPMQSLLETTYTELPPGVNAFIDDVRGQVVSATTTNQKDLSLAVGLRWDFFDNMALKFEVLEIKPQGGTWGVLSGSSSITPKDTYVYSAVFDLIF